MTRSYVKIHLCHANIDDNKFISTPFGKEDYDNVMKKH